MLYFYRGQARQAARTASPRQLAGHEEPARGWPPRRPVPAGVVGRRGSKPTADDSVLTAPGSRGRERRASRKVMTNSAARGAVVEHRHVCLAHTPSTGVVEGEREREAGGGKGRDETRAWDTHIPI